MTDSWLRLASDEFPQCRSEPPDARSPFGAAKRRPRRRRSHGCDPVMQQTSGAGGDPPRECLLARQCLCDSRQTAGCAPADLELRGGVVNDLPLSVSEEFTSPSGFIGELSNRLAAEEKRWSIPWRFFHRWLDRVRGIDMVGSMPIDAAK
jgi:hypothetical protein